METLVVIDQHRNEHYTRGRAHGSARFGAYPSRGFKDINCRTFESGSGILPTPFKACTTTVTKRECTSSPKTPSPLVKSHPEESKHLKKPVKSSAIPIPINIKADPDVEGFFNDEFPYSELWAGPAYSNSPPPSSLPMPKFPLPPKRTISLNLPPSPASDMYFHPIAKSAPPSPTRDHSNPCSRDLFHSADSATKTLRRILNLDIADE
ncbi:hypothetical protein Acr_13g0002040 [Actinidia rufa]|uniref:Uncharacterized protein n=1 Tax=Actinidia rufa TaxID=165716 RepID=A0A7J0FJQ2_9ERIC|nr:hypothetical protein Acr_13g0002040 [Actinidia rufa]